MLSSHRLHFHRPDSFAMMVHIEFFAYQIYLLYAIHQILAVQLSINQFLQSHSNEKSDNLHHMQQLSYPQLFFQEKFFMTGKGMLYDVHFWKNDICNATELIYQKMTDQPCKH